MKNWVQRLQKKSLKPSAISALRDVIKGLISINISFVCLPVEIEKFEKRPELK